jgi:hypothetical protein
LLLFRLICGSRRSADKPAIASGYGRSRDVHRCRHHDREGDPQRFCRAARSSKISFAGVADIAATANPHPWAARGVALHLTPRAPAALDHRARQTGCFGFTLHPQVEHPPNTACFVSIFRLDPAKMPS